jgi:hypothetical protein
MKRWKEVGEKYLWWRRDIPDKVGKLNLGLKREFKFALCTPHFAEDVTSLKMSSWIC